MRRLAFDQQLLTLALLAALPGWLALAWLIWQAPWSGYPKVLLLVLSAGLIAACVLAIRHKLRYQLRTLANLVEGLRAGDFTLRIRARGQGDVLSELIAEINQLSDTLLQQRLRSEEAQRLVESVVDGIDVAIFAFDASNALSLINPAGQALLQQTAAQALGQDAQSLGLSDLLQSASQQVVDLVFPGAAGLWQVRQQGYRVAGQQHRLLFVTDLKQVLRQEELQAWKRLIRVLSHEVNNSLGPIASISATLSKLLQREPPPADWRDDMQDGLAIVEERAQRLAEFVRRYAELARLPEPRKQLFDLAALLQGLPLLYPAAQLRLHGIDGPLQFYGDASQIEQLLINLLKNAVEAGGAPVDLHLQATPLEIELRDHGPGIANPANLFVPFYTTKAGGSGIGLVLCRQIVEAHQGSLSLHNHREGGCSVRIRFAQSS